MPVFGEYETFGEPIAVTEERGHTSTVWQARLSGSKDGKAFAIKCYLPRPRRPKPGEPEDALDKDRGLEFLDAIKQLKKAQTDGGRCLSPIHAFGIAPEGAWYVTDFYQGRTLKELIVRRGKVDSAALRHVVRSVVTACLALKRSRGYSHGNLKPANVFLVGTPKALSKRPIELGDPYPASAGQLAGLDEEDRRAVSDLLNQTVEAEDLRSLGELLLQLVRGRVIANKFDFDYPIARTPAWDHLGKDGETWRELTNQLLSPQLSLETINLETLEKRFQPTMDTGKLRKLAMAAGGVILVGGLLYGAVAMRGSKQRTNFKQHYRQAQTAWEAKNLLPAKKEVELALTFAPRNAADLNSAKELKTQIEQRLDNYTRALTEARREFKAGNPGPAAKHLEEAAALYPEGALIPSEREYGEALTQARKEFEARQWSNAISNADRVLAIEKGDELALRLKSNAQTQIARANDERTKKAVAAFSQAILAARTALEQTNAASAKTQFEAAKKSAAELADRAKESEADEGLGLVEQISKALAAKNVDEEIAFLTEASRSKNAPKMLAGMLANAQGKKAAAEKGTKAEKLGTALTRGRASLEQTNVAGATTEFQTAKALARELLDRAKEGEADEGLTVAEQIGKALAAKDVNEEIRWLQDATKARNAPKMLAGMLANAQARKNVAERGTKGEKLASALTSGRSHLERTNVAGATTEYQTAKALGHELQDVSKEKEADDGLVFAEQIKKILEAKDVDEQIKLLQQTSTTRNAPAVLAGMLANAQAKKAAAEKSARTNNLASALSRGRGLLELTNVSGAKTEFDAAKTFARELQDRTKEGEADDALALTEQLRKALAAPNLDEQIKLLQQVSTNKNSPKMVAGMLANAQAKKSTVEQGAKAANLTAALTRGRSLLEQTNTAGAKTEFQTAKSLAKDLQDLAKESEADEGLALADQIGRAMTATDVSEEINLLQQASTNKSAPKMLAGMLANAQARRRGTIGTQLNDVLLQAAGFLEQTNVIGARERFQSAKQLAGQVPDQAKQTEADEGLAVTELLAKALTAKNSGKVDNEISLLQQASRGKKPPKMLAGWAQDANARKTQEADRAGMAEAVGRATAALNAGNFVSAETNFATAAGFAARLKDNTTARLQSLKEFAGTFAGLLTLGRDQGVRAFELASGAMTKALATPSFPREALTMATNITTGLVTNGYQAALDAEDREEAVAWLGRAKTYGLLDAAAIAAIEKRISDLPPPAPKELSPFHGITFVKVGKSPTAGKVFYASKYEITAGQFNELVNGAPAAPQEVLPAACDAQAAADFCGRLNKLLPAECGRLGLKGGSIKLPSRDDYLTMARVSPEQMDDKTLFRVSPAAFTKIKQSGEVVGLGISGKVQVAVPGQCTNTLGLVNIIGNIPEWSEDGKVLGLTYCGGTGGAGRRFINNDPIPNTDVGFRPILIPE